MVTKLFPAAGSSSIFKNLGLNFQSISKNFPIVLIVSASPMTVVNKPCAFVFTFLISTYSGTPVAEPWIILNLNVMSCDEMITLFVVLATPWKFKPDCAFKFVTNETNRSMHKYLNNIL